MLDADAKGLTKDERNEIVGDWVEDWHGSPKNGHTTHLLMSFPSHVRPEKAKLIAEAWAFEMLQSGEHQDDVWSYVAALHTDKAHPHVHMVINNRGTVNDSWLFMAAGRLKADIVGNALSLGFSGDRMAERLETGAANAWEERDWVRSDLLALSGRQRADLRNPDQSWKVVNDLEGFYEAAAKLIEQARTHELVPDNDRLLRSLGSMGRIMQVDGKVEFRGDAHAERFADALRQRYGEGIVADLTSGRMDALAMPTLLASLPTVT